MDEESGEMLDDDGESLAVPESPEVITVGVDGSTANLAAVNWAGETARRTGLPLDVVHVVEQEWQTSPYLSGEQVRQAAEDAIAVAMDELARSFADVPATSRQSLGQASPELQTAAPGSTMLVLGRRGRGSFSRLLLGSVSAAVANKAVVPTVVVPSGWTCAAHVDDGIVVGIDGSSGGDSALRYGVDLALEMGRELRVVYVWGPDGVFAAETGLAHGGLQQWCSDAAELLHLAIDPWQEKFPDLVITERLLQDHVVRGLVRESAEAYALVVGGHQAGRLHATWVGSTTNGVLNHAGCPIIVLPEERHHDAA